MHPSAMDPLFPEADGAFERDALDLHKEAGALSATAHPLTRDALARLVLIVNSYYSNLIEGIRTDPLDVEAALKADFSKDAERTATQRLAIAHLRIDDAIMAELKADPSIEVTAPIFLTRLHRELYAGVPPDELIARGPDGTTARITPGAFRTRDVRVGAHIAPPHADLESLLARFHEAYRPGPLSPVRRVVALAASHHRLAWIHPFVDGNGRVARLMTTAYARCIGLDAGGLWSVARGFARFNKEYYAALAAADEARRNDYDGRGTLSLAALEEWCRFVLRTAMDQIAYMRSLLKPETLASRLRAYAGYRAGGGESVMPGVEGVTASGILPWKAESGELLAKLVLLGELSRADALALLPGAERTRRMTLRTLFLDGVITADHHRGPVRLEFPPHVAHIVFPDIFTLPVREF